MVVTTAYESFRRLAPSPHRKSSDKTLTDLAATCVQTPHPPRSLQPKPLQHHWTRSDEAQLSEEFLAHRRTSTFQKKEAKWKTVPFNSKNSSKHDFECHALQKQQRREAVDILNSAYMQISTTSLWNIINKPTQTIREETPYHPAAAALRSSMNRRYLERKITCSFCHKKKKKSIYNPSHLFSSKPLFSILYQI